MFKDRLFSQFLQSQTLNLLHQIIKKVAAGGGGEGRVQGRDQQDTEVFTALLTMPFTGAVGLRGPVSLGGVLEVKPHQETPPTLPALQLNRPCNKPCLRRLPRHSYTL